jgi:hypothetical protein
MKASMPRAKSLLQKLKPYFILLAPSLGIGVILGVYPGYKIYEYIWVDARFCTGCHLHDYASISWKDSSHGRLTTCHDCHHQPLRDYIRESFILLSGRPNFPAALKHTPNVAKNLCQACHITNPEDRSTITAPISEETLNKLPKVDQMHLHKIHLEKKVKHVLPSKFHLTEQELYGLPNATPEAGPERLISCIDCHGGPPNRGHNFTSTDRSCYACHYKIHKTSIAGEVGCRSCHFQDFMLPVNYWKPSDKPANAGSK